MQKRKIQMIVYDGSRVGAFVSALLLALVFIGALPPEDRKVNEMLKVQQQNTVALIQRQAETLTARSIALSEELTQELEQVLSTRGKTFEEINNDPELIFELETAAYSSVKAALNTNYCSGAFFIMDATVNTEIEKAETSRMGVYLRLSDLKAVSSYNQHIKYFRGMAEVARKDNVELHNRWNLEFDISNLPSSIYVWCTACTDIHARNIHNTDLPFNFNLTSVSQIFQLFLCRVKNLYIQILVNDAIRLFFDFFQLLLCNRSVKIHRTVISSKMESYIVVSESSMYNS